MSISSLLFTSRDALMSQQMAIDITGGNIANVNTPGYSQQRASLKSIGSVNVSGASAQIGVTVSRVERVYDSYLESQIVGQQQNMGYSDAMLQGLQNIEVMLDDTQGGGISDQLNQFWAAWENLSNTPGGKVERSALLSAAENLTSSLASYRQNLDAINTDMNRNISDAVSQINGKVNEIADLNTQILGTANGRGDENGLLDKRTQALKELGALVNVNSFEDANGVVNIYLANGDPLLQGGMTQPLRAKVNAAGRMDVYSSGSPGEAANNALTKGKLGAYIELQTSIIPEYKSDIDSFAKGLADRVNELHSTAFDAYKNTGTDFFTIPNLNNIAGTIRVNSAIASDTNRIAVSATVSGDGSVASKLAAVQDELVMDNGTSTLNGFLATSVGRIGNQVASAKSYNDHQTIISNHLDTQREAVSGVSIDEEMIRLIKYQMGYNAAGKVISVVDELMETLMGLVK